MTPNQIPSFFPRLLLLSPLFPLQFLSAQEPVILETPKTGKVAFVQRARQEQHIDAGGQQIEMSQELTHHFTVEATKVGEDGKRTFTVSMQRVHGKFDVPMAGGVDFDSDAKEGEGGEASDEMEAMGMPSASSINAALKEIVGKSFTAEVSADGTIHGTAGFDAVRKLAETKLGQSAPMLASAMSDRALQNLVRAALGHLPKQPAKPGDSWEAKVESGSNLPMEQSLKLKLDEADTESAKVSYTGTIALSQGGAARGGEGGPTIEDGKLDGSLVLSRKDGFTKMLKSVSSMTLLTESPMGEMAVEMKQTLEVSRADATKAEAPTKTEAKPDAGK